MKAQFLVILVALSSVLSNHSFAQGTACQGVPQIFNNCLTCPYGFGYLNGSQPGPQLTVINNGTQTSVVWPRIGTGYYYVLVDPETILQFQINIIPEMSFATSSSSFLCNGQTGTLTITDACGAASYSWTAPTGWSINGGGNSLKTSSESISITAPSSGNGYASISVTSTYNVAVSTSVWFGTPTIMGPTVSGPCEDPSYTYSVPSGASSYTWSINNPSLGFSGSSNSAYIGSGDAAIGGNPFYLYLTVTVGGCSFNISRFGNYILKSPAQCGGGGGGGGGGGKLRTAAPDSLADDQNSIGLEKNSVMNLPYPNPANNQFSVITDGQNSLTLTSSTGKIINQFLGEGKIDIDTHDLPSGLYFLSIFNGKNAIRKKILIAH
jgi:hypothetical protein